MSHPSGIGQNSHAEQQPAVISQNEQNDILLKQCSDLTKLLNTKSADENRVKQLTKSNLKNLEFNEEEGVDSFLTVIETVALAYD